MQRALIIDSHPLVCLALTHLLIDQNFTEVEEAAYADFVMQQAHRLQPELIILGINQPESAGLMLLKSLVVLAFAPKVIVYAADPESRFSECYLQAGAASVIDKSAHLSILTKAVKEIAAAR